MMIDRSRQTILGAHRTTINRWGQAVIIRFRQAILDAYRMHNEQVGVHHPQ